MDLPTYRRTAREQARIKDVLRLVPQGRTSVLEIGARDGYVTRFLAERFERVVALDLEKPAFHIEGVLTVQGDVRALPFADATFDCVVCTEVLEHVPDLERAAAEVARVARHEIIIGVPYRQDLRVGRTTCPYCDQVNPPWGHVHSFDAPRLEGLFQGCEPVATSFVWQNRDRTNPLSAWLMDRAGNPWGTYHQAEPCIHCGGTLQAPARSTFARKVLAGLAQRLNAVQRWAVRERPTWIHVVFRKELAGISAATQPRRPASMVR